MNVFTWSASGPTPESTATQTSPLVVANPLIWQLIAVVALLTTAAGVSLTGTMDLCSSTGSIALAVAWFIPPITAISSIVVAAMATDRTIERYFAATVAVGLTAMWLFALVWAQVGEAIDRVAC